MTKNTTRAILGAAVLAALVVLPLYAFKVYFKIDYTDFMVYYRSASRARDQMWEMVYTLADGASPFRYPPILIPLFRPFTIFSLRTAQVLWYFCQFASFATGFGFLYRAARLINTERAGIATALSFFFILRFCLDTFTIGQVSSLMFMGYCLGLYGYVRGDFFASGSGLFIPTLFKIGPGFSYFLFMFSKLERCMRAWLAPLIWIIALTLLAGFSFGWGNFSLLTSHWAATVAADDKYYDASHYGSQALKSVLLRLSLAGWVSMGHAYTLWFVSSVVGCASVLWIWATRRAKSLEGQGLLFALGVFPYLWFMPETFKYTLSMLALPALMLVLSRERTKLKMFALVLGFVTLSAAGKDFLPDVIFFGLQKESVPFFTTLVIAAATLQLLWRETISWKEQPLGLPRPWEQLPVEAKLEGVSVLIPLTDRLPGRASLAMIAELQGALKRKFGAQWELIWIAPANTATKLRTLIEALPQSKLVFTSDSGRGASLRQGFLASSGKWIYLYRLEQPVGVQFLHEAMDRILKGDQLVKANRRDPQTRFLIPVKFLNVAYGRHRLGLLFNRLVRIFIPLVASTDTHSGHVVITRRAASQVFALQTSGDFLFDLELSVISKAHGFRESELPVRLYVLEEKSTERILSEVFSIMTGLPRLRRRLRGGFYHPLKSAGSITADDWGLSPAVNQGILDLARRGVVSRVSLMANTQFLTDQLDELKAIPGIRLGIHFTLTYGRPLTPGYRPSSPAQMLMRWMSPFGGKAELRNQIHSELRAQLKLLKSHGVQVSHFDGHHHIQLLPGLLNDLAPILREEGIGTVRIPYDPELKFSKKFPLVILSILAQRSLSKQNFECLQVFYPQRAHFRDHGLMRAKINRNPLAEVIVHPASHNDIDSLEFPDSYTDGRVDEFRALQMLGFVSREVTS